MELHFPHLIRVFYGPGLPLRVKDFRICCKKTMRFYTLFPETRFPHDLRQTSDFI